MRGFLETCRTCGLIVDGPTGRWRCDGCGGALELAGPGIDPLATRSHRRSLWRFGSSLPAGGPSGRRATLGEGLTPLVPLRTGLSLKLDHVMPTGSFKDRGTAVMLSVARDVGARRAVADSSGNAGLSASAYAARLGIDITVFVPVDAPQAKVMAMRAHGADVRLVEGSREAAAAEAIREVEGSAAFYASHVHQPAFAHGLKTLAFELAVEMRRHPPATVVVPAGNGTLVLGLWLGFSELARAGRIGAPPAIIAVQTSSCAPLAGLPPAGRTVAVGIAVAEPPRGAEVGAAVRASGGRVAVVSEDEIDAARSELARKGLWVDPAAAAGWAGWTQLEGELAEPAVVVITGKA